MLQSETPCDFVTQCYAQLVILTCGFSCPGARSQSHSVPALVYHLQVSWPLTANEIPRHIFNKNHQSTTSTYHNQKLRGVDDSELSLTYTCDSNAEFLSVNKITDALSALDSSSFSFARIMIASENCINDKKTQLVFKTIFEKQTKDNFCEW